MAMRQEVTGLHRNVGLNRRRFIVAIVASIATLPALADARKRRKKKKKKKDKKPTSPMPSPPPPPPPPPREPITFSGSGPTVTQDFSLRAGLYLVDATITTLDPTGGLFFVDLYSGGGQVDWLVIENPEFAGTFTYRDLTDVPADGTYFLHIDEAAGAWQVTLTPR